jgi:hypothetical protein
VNAGKSEGVLPGIRRAIPTSLRAIIPEITPGFGLQFPQARYGHAKCYSVGMDRSKKIEILHAAKEELLRHSLGTFVSDPPSIAEGGSGVVVSGCPACQKKFGTNPQLMLHLSDDVLPKILREAFAIAKETE